MRSLCYRFINIINTVGDCYKEYQESTVIFLYEGTLVKTFLPLLALALLTSTTSFAGGYGAAGCGLGSMVLGQNNGFAQVFAATTNGTFASQTFGITSGTSNCGGGGSSPTSLQYIEANKVSLASEASQGNGETVKGLAELMGCSNSKLFGATLQKNYNQIFPTQDIAANNINASIYNVIKADSKLKDTCKAI